MKEFYRWHLRKLVHRWCSSGKGTKKAVSEYLEHKEEKLRSTGVLIE